MINRALSKEEILEIYLAVIESDHGEFLKDFARAIRRADDENFEVLRGPALHFIAKYELYRLLT